MPSGLQTWSKTPGSNATADSSINWAEGQAPSSINDSARAMMARIAEWRDDISGALTTSGSSSAYAVSSNRGFASLAAMDKSLITIVPHTTCGIDPTLNVDGLGAKQIRTASGVNVSAGALVAGTPYALIYLNATTEFILLGFTADPYVVPIGTVLDYVGTTAPNSSFALCFGQAISRSTYATLFTLISTTFGIGDGSTTFNLPDCRGRVIAGKDDMGGVSADRLTNQSGGLNGDTMGATGGSETHPLTLAQLAAHDHGGSTGSAGAHTHFVANSDGQAGSNTLSSTTFLTRFANGFAGPNNELTGDGTTADRGLTSSTGAHSHTISSAGSGSAHNNVQPTLVLSKIVRLI